MHHSVKYLGKGISEGCERFAGVGLLKRAKPMPWKVFLGSMLTMFSVFIAFIFNYTILGQSLGKDVLLQPAATLLSVALLVLGLALVFTGLNKMESK